jgi:hypothetical protein
LPSERSTSKYRQGRSSINVVFGLHGHVTPQALLPAADQHHLVGSTEAIWRPIGRLLYG